ncbi:iron-sulfur cluster repair di-iron protein [Gaetbulibacter aestuarii]|uniref:Iron-sulfur cluster repair di-iron protein n=1 Tax=Gaetbulibacter aestuarii TaxID=1502358 RepID=A0ABW7N1B7_9FLAO
MELLDKDLEKPIGQFVAEDFRTAAIFSNYAIDFCCKGDKTLDEVCTKKGLDSSEILAQLQAVLQSQTDQSIDYKSWPLDLLVDYIEKKHHRYVEEKIPVLLQFLNKLKVVHGKRHPELLKINEEFTACANALTLHMKKEELVLFPFVKRLVNAISGDESIQSPQFKTVENPIAMMLQEHDTEGERFRRISELTDNYTPPVDACNTYRVTFAMLDEFEKDLHLHIHLENNILFPEAIKLEKKLSA